MKIILFVSNLYKNVIQIVRIVIENGVVQRTINFKRIIIIMSFTDGWRKCINRFSRWIWLIKRKLHRFYNNSIICNKNHLP